MADQKYRIAKKCPKGLPKAHRGTEWLNLIKDPATPPFLEGLVLYQAKICALGYFGNGHVVAMPLDELPTRSFSYYFSAEDQATLAGYLDRYNAGEWEAVESADHPNQDQGPLIGGAVSW